MNELEADNTKLQCINPQFQPVVKVIDQVSRFRIPYNLHHSWCEGAPTFLDNVGNLFGNTDKSSVSGCQPAALRHVAEAGQLTKAHPFGIYSYNESVITFRTQFMNHKNKNATFPQLYL